MNLYDCLLNQFYSERIGAKSATSPEQMDRLVYDTFYNAMINTGSFSGEQLAKIASDDRAKYDESVTEWLKPLVKQAHDDAANLVAADLFSNRVAGRLAGITNELTTKIANDVMRKIADGIDGVPFDTKGPAAEGLLSKAKGMAQRGYDAARPHAGTAAKVVGGTTALAGSLYGAKKLHGMWKKRKEDQAAAAASTPPGSPEAAKVANWIKVANDPSFDNAIVLQATMFEEDYASTGTFQVPVNTGSDAQDFVNHNAAALVADAYNLTLQ